MYWLFIIYLVVIFHLKSEEDINVTNVMAIHPTGSDIFCCNVFKTFPATPQTFLSLPLMICMVIFHRCTVARKLSGHYPRKLYGWAQMSNSIGPHIKLPSPCQLPWVRLQNSERENGHVDDVNQREACILFCLHVCCFSILCWYCRYVQIHVVLMSTTKQASLQMSPPPHAQSTQAPSLALTKSISCRWEHD